MNITPVFEKDPEDELNDLLGHRFTINRQIIEAEKYGDRNLASALEADKRVVGCSIDLLRKIVRRGRYEVL